MTVALLHQYGVGVPAARSRDSVALRVIEIIEQARSESGISQERLATAAGVSQGQVSKILSGKVDMKVADFVAFCDALDLNPAAVIDAAQR